MWAKTLLSLVGGVRAAIFLCISLCLMCVVISQMIKIDSQKDAHDVYVAKVVAATSKAKDAANVALIKSKEALVEYYEKSRLAGEAYSAGRQSAINAKSVLVADLESERIRLRNEWRGCESDRVREGQPLAGTPQGSDAEARERIEGASNLIGNADQADLTITWLQSELIATRELYGKCMVPKEK